MFLETDNAYIAGPSFWSYEDAGLSHSWDLGLDNYNDIIGSLH